MQVMPRTARTSEKAQTQQILGARLRAARLSAGVSLADMAQQVGRSVPTISRIETGQIALDVHLLLEMAKALGVSPSVILP